VARVLSIQSAICLRNSFALRWGIVPETAWHLAVEGGT
jgi:hypothetical protein